MGVLKAKVGGSWVDIGMSGADEVYVGATAPVDVTTELWYDTASNPTGVPWTAYTPTLTQPGAITKNVTNAVYMQIGKTVIAQVILYVTGAGTAGQGIKIGLPVAARNASAIQGTGSFYDVSASTRYVCEVGGASTTEAYLAANGVSSDILGVSPSIALANADGLRYNIIYEAA